MCMCVCVLVRTLVILYTFLSPGGNTAQNLSQSKVYSAMVDMGKYMTLVS